MVKYRRPDFGSGGPRPRRLKMPRKIKLLDPAVPLAPYRVPQLPPGRFVRCEGQMALDFDSDDPDALVEPP
jgi:hypothetical protein